MSWSLFLCQKSLLVRGKGMYKSEIKEYIETYVAELLHEHDLAVWRNATNKAIYDRIIEKCFSDLESPELVQNLDNKNQVKYFVEQTILYLVLHD